jgi:hypothetical protein
MNLRLYSQKISAGGRREEAAHDVRVSRRRRHAHRPCMKRSPCRAPTISESRSATASPPSALPGAPIALIRCRSVHLRKSRDDLHRRRTLLRRQLSGVGRQAPHPIRPVTTTCTGVVFVTQATSNATPVSQRIIADVIRADEEIVHRGKRFRLVLNYTPVNKQKASDAKEDSNFGIHRCSSPRA